MLYILYRGNHEDITYREGQEPIVHLQLDMQKVIDWADAGNKKWAFTVSNAGATLTTFYNDLQSLHEINWHAVEARYFTDSTIKEGKQAEFLVYDFVPWNLVDKIGVINSEIENQARAVVEQSEHKPQIKVERQWYF